MKPSYRNNQMRVGALEKIVKEMGIKGFTFADAMQKVKSLRNTYNQQLLMVLEHEINVGEFCSCFL
jgi:hypothetical protein